MQKHLTTILIILYSLNSYAQSEDELVKSALIKYIKGTENTEPNLLKEAFSKHSDLYLTKNNALWKVPSAEYISWYEKDATGTSTGRVGKILSINRTNDVATAKLEVAIPDKDWLFTDYMLLKKEDGIWKIISKTATGATSKKSKINVLFIVSNAHVYGKSKLNTANHFAEIVFAYDEFKQAGFNVNFVSPDGGAIPLGYIQTSDPTIKKYLYDSDFMYQLEHTLSPSEVNSEKYKAVYYVGGGAAMFGVPENLAIQNISMKVFEQNNGIVSAVCHGSAGIVNLKTSDGEYLVKNKSVNGFPDIFENMKASYYQEFPFSIEDKLKEHGGNFSFSKEGWDNYSIADGRLITGQDPTAARSVAKKVIERLNN